MERPDRLRQSDAQVSDRFGFLKYDISSNESKSDLRIHVSSSGKATQSKLPPLTDFSNFLKLLNSPWLKDYKHFSQCLTHALRDDPYPSQSTDENTNHVTPTLIGSSPDEKNMTVFSSDTIEITLFLNKDNLDEIIKRGSLEMFPFGLRYYQLPQCPVTFGLYHPNQGQLMARLHGQISLDHGLSLIRQTRLENLNGDPLTWSEIPIGVRVHAIINISQILPISLEAQTRLKEDKNKPKDNESMEGII